MTKSFLVFPNGATGAGFLLLRAILSAALVMCLPYLGPDLMKAGIVCVALALCGGLWTRAAALIAALILVAVAIDLGARLGLFIGLHAGVAVASALVGPGGYSVDALRFGRRIIDLD